jgi:hypothetical protein
MNWGHPSIVPTVIWPAVPWAAATDPVLLIMSIRSNAGPHAHLTVFPSTKVNHGGLPPPIVTVTMTGGVSSPFPLTEHPSTVRGPPPETMGRELLPAAPGASSGFSANSPPRSSPAECRESAPESAGHPAETPLHRFAHARAGDLCRMTRTGRRAPRLARRGGYVRTNGRYAGDVNARSWSLDGAERETRAPVTG